MGKRGLGDRLVRLINDPAAEPNPSAQFGDERASEEVTETFTLKVLQRQRICRGFDRSRNKIRVPRFEVKAAMVDWYDRTSPVSFGVCRRCRGTLGRDSWPLARSFAPGGITAAAELDPN